MVDADTLATSRLLALLAAAELHGELSTHARAGVASFMLGVSVGLALGLTDPTWSTTALDELAELLAADDGRLSSAHRSELRALARRLIVEAGAIERGER